MRYRFRDDSTADVWAVLVTLLAWLAMAATLWLLFGGEAQAQPIETQGGEAIEIRIPVDTIRGPAGSIHPVGSAEISNAWICGVTVEAENNDSEHPDTDVLVDDLVIPDVEAVANARSAGSGTVVSDGLIKAAIRLGPDGVTSSGLVIILDCGPPNAGTTTTTSTPTTSQTPTSTTLALPTTTTLSPPPSGPVEAGGGALADALVGTRNEVLGLVLSIGGIAAIVIGVLSGAELFRERRRR